MNSTEKRKVLLLLLMLAPLHKECGLKHTVLDNSPHWYLSQVGNNNNHHLINRALFEDSEDYTVLYIKGTEKRIKAMVQRTMRKQ